MDVRHHHAHGPHYGCALHDQSKDQRCVYQFVSVVHLVHRCFVRIDHCGYTVSETKMFLGFHCSKTTNRFPRKIQTRFDLMEMHGGFDQVPPDEQHQGKHMDHVVSLVGSGRPRLENPLPLASHAVPDGTCATRRLSCQPEP